MFSLAMLRNGTHQVGETANVNASLDQRNFVRDAFCKTIAEKCLQCYSRSTVYSHVELISNVRIIMMLINATRVLHA